jgi:hypothetical protein
MTKPTVAMIVKAFAGAAIVYLAYHMITASSASALFTVDQYVSSAIVTMILGISILFWSFLNRKKKSILPNIGLSACFILLFISMTDLYVLFFRFDTLGPGSGYCLTNVRWSVSSN